MIILSAQDLEDYGIRQTASTITFMGKAFVRGQTFARRLREVAIAMAEESMAKGAACLLVDFETHITVWREQNKQSSSNPQAFNGSAQSVKRQPSVKASSAQLTYRGQASPPVPTPQEKSHSPELSIHNLTYRGKAVPPPSTQPLKTKPSSALSNGKQQQPKPQRRMRYRGQWVDVD